MTPVERSLSARLVRVVSIGLALCLFLIPVRAQILGAQPLEVLASPSLFSWSVLRSYYDFVYVAALTGIGLTCLWLVRRSWWLQRLVMVVYVLVALASLLVGIVNVTALRALGGPVTYQWLYYSDFLRSYDARLAIASHLSWRLVVGMVLACIAMLLAAKLLAGAIRRLFGSQDPRRLLVVSGLALLLYLGLASWRWDRVHVSEAKLENPVVAFMESVGAVRQSPLLALLTRPTTIRGDELSKAADRGKEGRGPHSPALPRAGNANIRNVVIFVLESVSAEYIGAYGSTVALTPEIDRYSKGARLFSSMYAHAPTTESALVSLLLSIYPSLSYRGLTAPYPGIPLPSLSSELHRRGYRTAFFSASDNRFQSFDEFLSYRNFDVVADQSSLKCTPTAPGAKTVNWPSKYGIDDECLVWELGDWVRQTPGRPFLAILWTMQTHYPYMFSGAERQFVVGDKALNRYLNALHHSDQVFGKLMQTLNEQGLLDSTLVVVVGDHGEAFGQHGRRAHGELLYEEDLRVPLLLVNPRLFSGEVDSIVSGMKDIAPTLMDLLGYPAPHVWQGRSLIGSDRSNLVYFLAHRADLRFGYRDDRYKFLFNATENTAELFDLRNDPRETMNQAAQSPTIIQAGVERVAAWLQHHEKFLGVWRLRKPN
jgi:arylsulfatase A-like enzyme